MCPYLLLYGERNRSIAVMRPAPKLVTPPSVMVSMAAMAFSCQYQASINVTAYSRHIKIKVVFQSTLNLINTVRWWDVLIKISTFQSHYDLIDFATNSI